MEVLELVFRKLYTGAFAFFQDYRSGGHQQTVHAFVRSLVGVLSIWHAMPVAIVGMTITLWKSSLVESVLGVVEGVVNGFWHKLPMKWRVILPATGIALVLLAEHYIELPFVVRPFSVLAYFFALKLSAELAIRNLKKERIAHAGAEAAELNKLD
jgi:hypothetical protein